MENLQIYRCEKCGNIVTVLNAGGGTLTCCDQAMTLLKENSTDAAQEKHVPVIKRTGNVIEVSVGGVSHPMEEKHYIQWIEIIADGKSCISFLKPGMKPNAVFNVNAEKLIVRAYCNLHGLWKASV
ncbi:MAG: desulfoferrodoxin [bacterium]